MKTSACCLLVSVWAAAGCMNLSLAPHQSPRPAEAPVQTVRPSRPVPPVTADQVNESNSHEMATALKAKRPGISGGMRMTG